MKLIKSMKQLKFWSKTKNRKKFQQYHKLAYDHYIHPNFYNPPPSPDRPPPPPQPPSLCGRFISNVVEPSAPPLPPWLDIHEECSGQGSEKWVEPFLEVSELGSSEDRWAELDKWVDPDLEVGESDSSGDRLKSVSSLHEGCLGPESENLGEPLLEVGESGSGDERGLVGKRRGGDSSKVFGCVVDVTGFLFRCLFPCFRVSDPHKISDKVV